MSQNNQLNRNKIIENFHLPRWEDLPSIDLYVDQIITLIQEYLGAFFSQVDSAPLTKSMINNYVKAKIVDAPVNKKYPRISVAMIIVVYILKSCYTTDEVGKLIKMGICLDKPDIIYNRFCDAVENAVKDVFNGEVHIKNEMLPNRGSKYLMENFALSFACKFYVRKVFLCAKN